MEDIILYLTAFIAHAIGLCSIYLKRKQHVQRRIWVREIFQERNTKGVTGSLLPLLRSLDKEYYFDFMRMCPEQFDFLLAKIGPRIQKKNTRWRSAISAQDRLAVTLRFLASGETIRSLSFQFRMGRATISKIIPETCCAIWEALSQDFLKFPTRKEEWQQIAEGYNERWQFPHCVGAIDGKHVVIECPANSGSEYYNFKGTYSKVLMATCDAHYKFTMVDIGYPGSESDGGIFMRSAFGSSLESNALNLPPATNVGDFSMPYVFLGDEAFPLKTNLLRPYSRSSTMQLSQKIFNYRLSRARRTIENAFGILSARWRIFRRPLKLAEDTISKVIKATTCLHNFLICTNQRSRYCPAGYIDSEDWQGNVVEGEWRKEVGDVAGLVDITRLGANNSCRSATEMRDKVAHYLCNAGDVPWQQRIVSLS